MHDFRNFYSAQAHHTSATALKIFILEKVIFELNFRGKKMGTQVVDLKII